MSVTTDSTWAEHALASLRAAGLRRGGARVAVIEALARHRCAVSALELEQELAGGSSKVGRASVYRTLEEFAALGLLTRIEMTRGTAGYERVAPDGHHHHHAICSRCGRFVTFEDPALEQAIDRVANRIPFEVSEHDVVLRGLCQRCAN